MSFYYLLFCQLVVIKIKSINLRSINTLCNYLRQPGTCFDTRATIYTCNILLITGTNYVKDLHGNACALCNVLYVLPSAKDLHVLPGFAEELHSCTYLRKVGT